MNIRAWIIAGILALNIFEDLLKCCLFYFLIKILMNAM